MAALRESDLGTDLDNSSRTSSQKRHLEQSVDSTDDSEFEQASESDDDEDILVEKESPGDADKELEKKEKKIILRFKMAESHDQGTSNKQVEVGDLDWSDFDIKTINEILARREELNRIKRLAIGEQAQETKMSKLKKSSLAPAPLNLRKTRLAKASRPKDDIEEGEEVEDQEMEYQEQEQEEDEDETKQTAFVETGAEDDQDRMDVDGEEIDYIKEGERIGELFEDTVEAGAGAEAEAAEAKDEEADEADEEAEVLVQGQMSLHLPPRATMHTEEIDALEQSYEAGRQQRELRPHPAMVRGNGHIDVAQPGPPKDMRLVLQRELQREDRLLKDLKAEIIDKLYKLQAEEKLLRMIVKHDFDIPLDDVAADNNELAGSVNIDTPAYGGFSEVGNAEQQSDYAAAAAAAAAAMVAAT
ncbi:hypothetical protein J3B02_005577, partial [Coemansia erecta]